MVPVLPRLPLARVVTIVTEPRAGGDLHPVAVTKPEHSLPAAYDLAVTAGEPSSPAAGFPTLWPAA